MTEQQAPVRTLPAGRYLVDPAGSTVAFTTRHMFGLGGVRGAFTVTGGEITVSGDHVEALGTVDAASIDTGNPQRDRKVRSRTLLDADTHPQITLHAAGDLPGPVPGELTARGGAAPVSVVVVEATEAGGVLTARLTTSVDRYAHGITAMKGITGRRLELEMTARAVRA